MEILRVENLTKIYGKGSTEVVALDNVSFSVQKGEFVAIQVGLVYQFYNLIPILNVEENITLPLSLDNREVNQQELDELLKVLGLSERRNHLPNELSGGQQQRTSIGRALITNPTIILADEPTGNLDTKASDEIVELLKKSNWDYNQTIIMITHNMEIAKYADRVLQIEDGRIVGEQNESIK